MVVVGRFDVTSDVAAERWRLTLSDPLKSICIRRLTSTTFCRRRRSLDQCYCTCFVGARRLFVAGLIAISHSLLSV